MRARRAPRGGRRRCRDPAGSGRQPEFFSSHPNPENRIGHIEQAIREAFPNGVIWGNTQDGRGYDLVLMGTVEPLRINVDEIQAKLSRPEYAPVAKSLSQVGIYSAIDLFANYAGRGSEMRAWTADALINRDRNLKLQYLAGLGLNLYQSDRIYSEMLVHAKYPEGLFTGSNATLTALRDAIARAQGRGMVP